jgi:hypothetical protein
MKTPATAPKTMVNRRILTMEAMAPIGEDFIFVSIGILSVEA